MKNITRHTGTMDKLKRMDSSPNGNPRFSFRLDGYLVVTGVDSMHGYEVQNYEGQRCTVEIGTHYGKTTLNKIWNIES